MGFSGNINGRKANRPWVEGVENVFGLIAFLLTSALVLHSLGEGPPNRKKEKRKFEE